MNGCLKKVFNFLMMPSKTARTEYVQLSEVRSITFDGLGCKKENNTCP
jgi:hypothetical protein